MGGGRQPVGLRPVYRNQMIAGRIAADLAHGHKLKIAQVVQAMDQPATEDLRATELPLLFKALGQPKSATLRAAIAELRAWYDAGGLPPCHLARAPTTDLYTPAIELMDAWWPKLLSAEFGPMIGAPSMTAIETLLQLGGTAPVSGDGFNNGWFGYVSKDLRRVYRVGRERGALQRAYCGNLPRHRFSAKALRDRCTAALRNSLLAATAVTPQQLYGGVCPSDPEPACADRNSWTGASAISIPPFPFQNRPTFQQVVTLTRTLPR